MGWVTKSSVISHRHHGAPNFILGKNCLLQRQKVLVKAVKILQNLFKKP